jgi:hypothetical protein
VQFEAVRLEKPAMFIEFPAMLVEFSAVLLEYLAVLLEDPAVLVKLPAVCLEDPAVLVELPAMDFNTILEALLRSGLRVDLLLDPLEPLFGHDDSHLRAAFVLTGSRRTTIPSSARLAKRAMCVPIGNAPNSRWGAGRIAETAIHERPNDCSIGSVSSGTLICQATPGESHQ